MRKFPRGCQNSPKGSVGFALRVSDFPRRDVKFAPRVSDLPHTWSLVLGTIVNVFGGVKLLISLKAGLQVIKVSFRINYISLE